MLHSSGHQSIWAAILQNLVIKLIARGGGEGRGGGKDNSKIGLIPFTAATRDEQRGHSRNISWKGRFRNIEKREQSRNNLAENI